MNSISPGAARKPLEAAQLQRRYAAGESELFVLLADWARREGHPDEALRLLERGLAQSPGRVSAWVLLARLKSQLGQLEEARGIYQRILETLDSRNLPALRALAVMSVAAGELPEAARYLKRWRREDPGDPELEDLLAEFESSEAAESPPAPAAARAAAAGSAQSRSASPAGEGGTQRFETPGPSDARPPAVHELGLADLERDYLPAPDADDARAWRDPLAPDSGARDS